jgi:hypothetical protein
VRFLRFLAVAGLIDDSPQMQTLSVSTGDPGECDGTTFVRSAAVLIEWSALNFNAEIHQYKLYESGVLKATQTGTSYTRDVPSRVEGGSSSPFSANWIFRVDLCDLSGSVISTMTAAEWTTAYGRCAGLPGDPLL